MDDDYNDFAGFASDDQGDSLDYTYSLPAFTVAEDRVTDDTGDDSSWWTDAPADDPFAEDSGGFDFSDVFDDIGNFFSSTLGKVFSRGGTTPSSNATPSRSGSSSGGSSSGSRNQTTNTSNVTNITNQNLLAFAVGAVAVLAVVYLLRRQTPAPAA